MVHKALEIRGHSGAIYTCAYDGHFLYTGSADKFVTRWNIELGIQDKFAIRFEQSVYAIELFNDKKQLAVGLSNGDLHFFDLHERKELKFFKQHIKGIFSIKHNPKLNHLYVGDADGNFSIWDTSELKLLLYLPLNCGKIRQMNVSPEGNRILMSCQDGTSRIFDTKTFNELITLENHEDGASSGIFHPLHQQQIITGGKNARLKTIDIESLEVLQNLPAHNYVIYDILPINEGKHFVTASRDKSIKIWDSITYKVIQKLDIKAGGHQHSVNALCPVDTNTFLSVGDDKRMILWRFNT